jgi:flavin-dependent dehydrogenase
LLDHALESGVYIQQPCQAFRPLTNKIGKVIGVKTSEGDFNSSYLIDAAGSQNWLANKLGLKMIKYSPTLIAYYGYVKGEFANCNRNPLLVADHYGWTWIAQVKPFVYQWTRLFFYYEKLDRQYVPTILQKMEKVGCTSCSDVTWRLSSLSSGSGFFLVGDAASVLDPASSHGIIKAMMSGILVGYLISKTEKLQVTAESATKIYNNWMNGWFRHDKNNLTKLYKELLNPPLWIL